MHQDASDHDELCCPCICFLMSCRSFTLDPVWQGFVYAMICCLVWQRSLARSSPFTAVFAVLSTVLSACRTASPWTRQLLSLLPMWQGRSARPEPSQRHSTNGKQATSAVTFVRTVFVDNPAPQERQQNEEATIDGIQPSESWRRLSCWDEAIGDQRQAARSRKGGAFLIHPPVSALNMHSTPYGLPYEPATSDFG